MLKRYRDSSIIGTVGTAEIDSAVRCAQRQVYPSNFWPRLGFVHEFFKL